MKKTHDECQDVLKPVRDALDVLNGKWKLPIIIALTFSEKRFTDISRELAGKLPMISGRRREEDTELI